MNTSTVTKAQINQFLASKEIAVAGVSRNEKKFGRIVFEELKKKGYNVVPVNPNIDQVDETKCYSSVDDLPPNVKSLLIVTPKNQTDNVLRQAIHKGIKYIWVQQMSETRETVSLAQEYDREIIHKKCIFMFAEPVVGVHKIHRFLAGLFGRLPG